MSRKAVNGQNYKKIGRKIFLKREKKRKKSQSAFLHKAVGL